MKRIFILTLCLLLSIAAFAQKKIVLSDELEVSYINPSAILHISVITLDNGDKFHCNGLIYMNGNEAIVMDTPPTDSLSNQLLDWIAKQYPGLKVTGIIVNHFHRDCLGGLNAFHDRGIPSYANTRTIKLAKKDKVAVPQHGFENTLTLKVGSADVISSYHGAAHTKDNIVTYMPADHLLFGGCMVKELNAGKGNLADANVRKWPSTIQHVKNAYPDAAVVIPGHGKVGDKQLLDYTIDLFSK